MPFKDKEAQREYLREYRKRNKEKIKGYYQDKKEINDERTNKYREEHPWLRFYTNARQRCENPNCPSYKWYGAKGIKFCLTLDEVKQLWFRDKAYEMNRPSIDRKKSDVDYCFSNCRFVELEVNTGRKVDSN